MDLIERRAISSNNTTSIYQHLLECEANYYKQIQEYKSPDIYVVRRIQSRDSTTGPLFALRRTKLDECEDLQFYENEIKLNNWLNHNNLLPFLSSFMRKNELWTIMPFAEFRSVADLSTPNGLSEEAIALIMSDVLNAVEYLHNNCIIHRSIRGSHILVFGSPKTEFVCRLSGLKYSMSFINNGEVEHPLYDYPKHAQTIINWLAPEVLEQNLCGYDTKSDIYSIGVTCCELANGFIPFAALDASEMLLNKLKGEKPPLIDSSSKSLKEVLKEELSPEMKSRYDKYCERTFSKSFMNFVVDCCLPLDPNRRSKASELLMHSFIKRNENLNKEEVLINSFFKNTLPVPII